VAKFTARRCARIAKWPASSFESEPARGLCGSAHIGASRGGVSALFITPEETLWEKSI